MTGSNTGSSRSTSGERVAIVVPCFNEADRLDAPALVGLAGVVGSVVFVDDGSTDHTAAVLAGLAATSPAVEVVTLLRNRGKAEAVRAGLRHAIRGGATVVGYYDADLATPPAELLRMVSALHEHPHVEVLLASRVGLLGHRIDRRPTRHYIGRLYATAASVALGVPVYDTQCGAKLFRVTPALTAALADRFPDRWSFDVELLGRLLHPERDVMALTPEHLLEVPLRAWRDVAGSKVSTMSGVRSLAALWGVRRRIRRRAGPGTL